jgi:hypothetical protein
MLKDYQEDTTAEKLAHEIAKLFDDGFATPTFGQIEKIELLVTTYGNARELEGVEKAKKEVEEYSKGIAKLHDRMIGSTHEDCKMMLAFDMHSRRVAIKHITKRLDHIAKVKSELK